MVRLNDGKGKLQLLRLGELLGQTHWIASTSRKSENEINKINNITYYYMDRNNAFYYNIRQLSI